MDAEKLYDMLKKVQEPKGYYFNRDKDRVFELLEALVGIDSRRFALEMRRAVWLMRAIA